MFFLFFLKSTVVDLDPWDSDFFPDPELFVLDPELFVSDPGKI